MKCTLQYFHKEEKLYSGIEAEATNQINFRSRTSSGNYENDEMGYDKYKAAGIFYYIIFVSKK